MIARKDEKARREGLIAGIFGALEPKRRIGMTPLAVSELGLSRGSSGVIVDVTYLY